MPRSTLEVAKGRERIPAILAHTGESVDGATLAREIARAVRDETRKWRSVSGAERDALTGEVAVMILTMRSEGRDPLAGREWHERNGYMRQRVRSLLRDSREWRDSLADVPMRDQRNGKRGKRSVMVAESVAEQAARYRESERQSRPAPMVSADALTDAESGEPVGLLAAAIARDATAQGEPPAALAEHSRELADALAAAVAARASFPLTPNALRDLRVALMAASEPLEAVARLQGCSLATVKRRRDAGRDTLRLAVSASELAKLRRDAADALSLVPPNDGPAWGESAALVRAADAAVSAGKRAAALRTLSSRSAEGTLSAAARTRLRGSGRKLTRGPSALRSYPCPARTMALRPDTPEQVRRMRLARSAAARSAAARKAKRESEQRHADWMRAAAAARYW